MRLRKLSVAWLPGWTRRRMPVARWSWEANILSYSLIVAIAGGLTLWARYWAAR